MKMMISLCLVKLNYHQFSLKYKIQSKLLATQNNHIRIWFRKHIALLRIKGKYLNRISISSNQQQANLIHFLEIIAIK